MTTAYPEYGLELQASRTSSLEELQPLVKERIFFLNYGRHISKN